MGGDGDCSFSCSESCPGGAAVGGTAGAKTGAGGPVHGRVSNARRKRAKELVELVDWQSVQVEERRRFFRCLLKQLPVDVGAHRRPKRKFRMST